MTAQENNTAQEEQSESQKSEPIRSTKDIMEIKRLLIDNPRNSTLFTLGINTTLMPNELLHLKVHQVKDIAENSVFTLTSESGKPKDITLNRIAFRSIKGLLESEEYEDDDFLFKSQRGKLIVPSLHRLVNKWCDAIGLSGNYGSHTLRKTWGYHQYHTFGTDISQLVKAFNHSSQKQTREYLCLEEENNFNFYLHEL
ncbi:MAG: tyrosine-type recombinase/integrase [Desulfobacteraceae bacterium]|nr:tyrosine-type recombinase/integrase [Desulfobacteraceae bacterium]